MSDDSIQTVLERLDAMTNEIRRQGRAAIAAQAAAEACSASVEALCHQVRQQTDAKASTPQDNGLEQLVRGLLPVADSVDRMRDQASKLTQSVTPPSLLARLAGVRDPSASVRSLAEAISVLALQLDGVLRNAGVEVDRKVGGAIDGDAHRVVEARAPDSNCSPGTVIQVVRPGYWLDGKCLREADVVATRLGSKSS